MARHRRDDQQLGVAGHALAREMLQLPERLAKQDIFVTGTIFLADHGGKQPEFGLAARRRGMGEHVERAATTGPIEL